MMKYTIFVMTLYVLFFSCSDDKGRGKYIEDSQMKIIPLEGIILKNDTPDMGFGFSSIVALHNSKLYLKSWAKDTLMMIYKINGDRLIAEGRFLEAGEGPYEISLNGMGYSYDAKRERISFFEHAGKLTRGYNISLKSDSTVYDKTSWELIDFKQMSTSGIMQSFTYISDSILLVTAGGEYDKEVILSVMDLSKGSIHSLDLWPDDGFKGNSIVKQSVYTNNEKLFKNDVLNKYLYVSGMGKYMELFSISNSYLIENRKKICNIYPRYQADTDNLNYDSDDDDINRGFSVSATDNYIYVKPIEFNLFQLRSPSAHTGIPLNASKRIDVFDWDGEYIKSYLLDEPFVSFIVDAKSTTLYIVTVDPKLGEGLVKKYILK